MHHPSPAIVPQSAVRRLPRAPLLLLCGLYVLLGFLGRDPWRQADADAFGRMWDMAQRDVHWLRISAVDVPHAPDAPLPYALGALSIDALQHLMPADWAVRLPFVAMLVLALVATWYAVYGLARLPQAQPVGFAFGGEAKPIDYARAMADGGLLALLACLGLPMLTHETTPALAQLAAASLAYLSVPMLLRGKMGGYTLFLAGIAGLALSGAPSVAMAFGIGSLAIVARQALLPQVPAWALSPPPFPSTAAQAPLPQMLRRELIPMAAVLLLVALMATGLELWRWRLQSVAADVFNAKGMARLMLWFGWPAMPLAVWTLWRWRRQRLSAHMALPVWYLMVTMATTLLTPAGERSLLLGLPALATLAAFALPTLRRSVSALIDWFSLLFFTGGAVALWVVWLSLEYGVPAKPASNIARLLPGYEHHSPAWAVMVALLASFAWCALVRWRVGRHPSVIWKSLVLPAAGTTLGWVLLMTLLLRPLDYGLSHTPLALRVQAALGPQPGCVQVRGLSQGLVTALQYRSGLVVRGITHPKSSACVWRLQSSTLDVGAGATEPGWQRVGSVLQGPRSSERVSVYRRQASP